MLTHIVTAHHRLLSQRIAMPRGDDPAEVVRCLGAVQAQDFGQALWAIGLRTHHATAQAIEQAIADRAILRTWPMRGTIHFVPSDDAKWMVALSAARMVAKDGRRLQQLELDYAIIERCAELFSAALVGGKHLPRSQLMELLEQAGIATRQQRGYHILWHLAHRGLLCIGPLIGKEPSFALLDEWAPRSRQLSREQALAELAERYMGGHGPATVHDFAWWAGLTVGEAKAGLEAAAAELVREQHDGKTYWTSRKAAQRAAPATAGVFLLPGFDEYLLGYKDRSAVLDAAHASKVVPGNNGVFMPIVVVDGQVVGTWKRAAKKQKIDITLRPFAPIDDLPIRAEQPARRYCEFLGMSLGSIDVAPDALN